MNSRTRRILAALMLTTIALISTQLVRAQTEIDIPYQKFVLKNGLTLIVHEDHKAPIVAVNIWYHVGSKNEKPGTHRLRSLVRASDVQRQREFQQGLLRAVRADRRHRSKRHHQRRPHQLLSERSIVGARRGSVDGVRPDGSSARRDRQGKARRTTRRRSEREAPRRKRTLRTGVLDRDARTSFRLAILTRGK